MRNKYTYTIIIAIITVILYYANEYLDAKNEHYPNSETTASSNYKEFDTSFLPKSTTGVIVEHNFYTLSYSENHEQAEWVAYELQKSQITNSNFKRPYFEEDRKVKSGSADWRNYKKSGYDKGHLCPAGDRKFDYNAYYETFLTSNISPQNKEFNRGVWNKLEQKTRYWAKKYDGVFVITGGVLEKGLEEIGTEGVSVPKYFYKIIIDTSNGDYKAIAFLIPNKKSTKSFYSYSVSIDEVETVTGIDFFPKLNDKIEKKLESEINLKAWGMR